ncbi:40S ribosomal protein S15 [Xylariaceae sp. FL0255]|nr:40S ribosomal protein S15 [Xylariaceae sp. FL0255]
MADDVDYKKRVFCKFSHREIELDNLLDLSSDQLRDVEKPKLIKTHLRNMIIVPEIVGSVIRIYNDKVFNQVEIKPNIVSHYVAEFSISYSPVKHGRPGFATNSCRFVPLK